MTDIGRRDVTVKFTPNDRGNPPGKLADAELHFLRGPLEGLKLIGFGIWERRGGSGRNVTFPARQYVVNVLSADGTRNARGPPPVSRSSMLAPSYSCRHPSQRSLRRSSTRTECCNNAKARRGSRYLSTSSVVTLKRRVFR
jgi:hypothetical protein